MADTLPVTFKKNIELEKKTKWGIPIFPYDLTDNMLVSIQIVNNLKATVSYI